MYEKEYLSIKTTLTNELLVLNAYIDKVESYSAITAPESSLGTIISEQKPSDVELKRSYVKKRKVMYFLEQLSSIDSFLCKDCGSIIELERLYVMPKACYCGACAIQQ